MSGPSQTVYLSPTGPALILVYDQGTNKLNAMPLHQDYPMPRESEYNKLLEDNDVKALYENLSQGSRITADIYMRRQEERNCENGFF